MSTTAAAVRPPDRAYPAFTPPPISPWNDYQFVPPNDHALSVLLIAEILMDDQWHPLEDVVGEVMYELELTDAQARKLITHLKSHGDVRQDNRQNIRLTTRWRGWNRQN
ncbi:MULTISPECIES: nucleoside/nucleotide kinase family protein [Mycobacterium avium complex (MAC)]|uniref:hypothetical protein n=1 Tax=Mycobacterium avium complex (MAC) TaxID=120793 RepID=UPI000B361EF5|nr:MULTISPECIES: hypothetical protein [Mycobacterium avium complex (MAC)]UCN12810.1 hypothetical protein LFT50_28205 [Mycobacterium intracellulare subsp. chimaera]